MTNLLKLMMNMVERVLGVVQKLLLTMVMLCIASIFVAQSQPVLANSTATRRVSGKSAMLDKISLGDFKQAGLDSKIRQVAELDDVKITCNATGMLPALIVDINVNDGVSVDERAAMLYNSWSLQNVISCAPSGTAIYLPEGTFYFVSGHLKMADDSNAYERHVIKPANNVSLVGAGTNQSGANTTLKPYSEVGEFTNNIKKQQLDGNGRIEGGLDMFFFNNYSAHGFDESRSDNYLVNADFYDFIIDSEKTRGAVYNTSGKGFMINLFRDCEWDNVTVMNTDGTGFGVDAPINGKISNSLAIGCGKNATKASQGGASGFGIGTGYSNSESMTISNSVALNNKIFGFFYEHQGRFGPNYYRATSAANEKAFRVVNSRAEGNMYNYGGMRANDVYYSNSESRATGSTILDVYFMDESRRVTVDNIAVTGSLVFDDIDYSSYYGTAVKWGAQYGLTNGVGYRRFGAGQTIRRADAVVLMWRLAHREGEVLSVVNNNLDPSNQRLQNINVCFADVPNNAYYSAAVKWAYDNGITTGTKGCSSPYAKDGTFDPNRGITRSEFVTMLWRLAGSPSAGSVQDFTDVTDKNSWYYNAVQWAAANGISNGIGENKFGPELDCLREQAITFLYRYAH